MQYFKLSKVFLRSVAERARQSCSVLFPMFRGCWSPKYRNRTTIYAMYVKPEPLNLNPDHKYDKIVRYHVM